jgi:hypothetical protein
VGTNGLAFEPRRQPLLPILIAMRNLTISTSSVRSSKSKAIPSCAVDCKKKELLGNFKNNGREWQAVGEDTVVNVYDFLSVTDGKAIPYGVYDLVHNRGTVLVGIDHDTAEFAVESIRRW